MFDYLVIEGDKSICLPSNFICSVKEDIDCIILETILEISCNLEGFYNVTLYFTEGPSLKVLVPLSATNISDITIKDPKYKALFTNRASLMPSLGFSKRD
jgi:hypothetical protein